jgi:hypothetical protein
MTAMLSSSIFYGFYTLFATFLAYDDEGVILTASRMFLEGQIFYKEVPWIYGPAHLAIIELLHRGMALPLDNSSARLMALFFWVLLGLLSGGLVYRIVRSLPWAAVTFGLVFMFTTSTVNEPGHPQVVIACLTILMPLLACCHSGSRSAGPWFLIGVLAGCIFHIKLNAGLFVLSAALLVLVGNVGGRSLNLLLRRALVLGSALFPFLLMAPALSQPDSLGYACICAIALTATAIALLNGAKADSAGFVTLLAFISGFTVLSVIALAYAWLHGASALDIVSNIIDYSRRQANFYHFFRDYSYVQILLALVSLVLVLTLQRPDQSASVQRLILLAKCWFVGISLFSLVIDNPANSHALLGWALPWVWLCVQYDRESGPGMGRVLLAAVAAWSPLLAYPVPGSQLYFGTFPLIIAAVFCLHDLVSDVTERTQTSKFPWYEGLIRFGPILAAVAVLVCLVNLGTSAKAHYDSLQPLDLPGTDYMRVTPRRAQIYRRLVHELEDADTVLVTSGFNSLSFWSGTDVPANILFNHSLAFLDVAQRRHVIAALQTAEQPVVIVNQRKSASQADLDVHMWIAQNFLPQRDIGPFTIMHRRPLSADEIGDDR